MTLAGNPLDEALDRLELAQQTLARIWAIEPADHATTSRDYGRGFADAIRRVREAATPDSPR